MPTMWTWITWRVRDVYVLQGWHTFCMVRLKPQAYSFDRQGHEPIAVVCSITTAVLTQHYLDVLVEPV